ncbi:AMP-binding enzyme [Streptomyces sp. CBMA123]|uniref:AMP-binding enzyme n=1 Tax=Streptomyces sp. CBMA123 TaxID=1896313 RepID=UPI0016621C1D|nr:hypothetical protein [Streptomyces sp. CBMA123]
MQVYWNNPHASAQTVTDGWLTTADLGYLDPAGYPWIVDRRSELILGGTQNVYPAEIEHILHTVPWVTDAAVVPAPHTTTGQTPVAFLQPAEPTDFDELQLIPTYIRELAGYKRPSHFIPVNQLPRNAVGRLLRRPLEQRAHEHVQDLRPRAPGSAGRSRAGGAGEVASGRGDGGELGEGTG